MNCKRGAARDTFFKESTSGIAGKVNLSNRDRDFEKEIDKVSGMSSFATRNTSSFAPKDFEGTYVGFANLPNQVYRKAVKRGFDFNLLVVGESGLGKSTFINSLFIANVYDSEHLGPSARPKKTAKVETTSLVLSEEGVQLRLNIIDTPGFGDAINNHLCWQPILECVESRFEDYLNKESRINRCSLPDPRIHCCLYFLSPNGHGMKAMDKEFMQRLHHRVNLIPVIGKADCMTSEECRDFKKTILNEIAQCNINLYDFPLLDNEEETKRLKMMKARIPFAVVASNSVVEVAGRRTRARVYPWGVVEVESLDHNDFTALRNMLVKTHMQDLKDVTNNVHYENYRYHKLAFVSTEVNAPSTNKSNHDSERSPMAQIEEEKREHLDKMRKMEREMEQVFETKVKEKLQKLKDSEADLKRRADQMKKNLENQEKDFFEKMKSFEAEKATWEEQNKSLLEDHSKKEKKKLF